MPVPIPLQEIKAAAARIEGAVVRTPLLPLEVDGLDANVYLKPENLQAIGSFKLRGAGNAIESMAEEELRHGVYTASAGNMAQGVAWYARKLGIQCHVFVPDHAPETKLAAIERLGASYTKLPFEAWWEILIRHEYPGAQGRFIHPVCDPNVIAGNGTIGLEILEDLPQVDTVIAPFGGGGLSGGIASALRQLKPDVRVFAAEVETAAPLSASLTQGSPAEVEYVPSFVDGIGSSGLLHEMWPLASTLLSGSLVVSLQEVADAIALIMNRCRMIAEGAGAASVAALNKLESGENIVCVVSGGNIDRDKLMEVVSS